MARTAVVIALAEALHHQVGHFTPTPDLEELELALAAFVGDQLFGIAAATGTDRLVRCDRFADLVEMLAQAKSRRDMEAVVAARAD